VWWLSWANTSVTEGVESVAAGRRVSDQSFDGASSRRDTEVFDGFAVRTPAPDYGQRGRMINVGVDANEFRPTDEAAIAELIGASPESSSPAIQ